MPEVRHNSGPPSQLFSSPPTASDGPDLYIQKLLAQGEAGGDHFSLRNEGHSIPVQEHGKGQYLNNFVKISGVIFAAVLGIIGIRKLAGASVAKATAKTVA